MPFCEGKSEIAPKRDRRDWNAETVDARESLDRLNRRIDAPQDRQHKAWLSVHRDHWWSEVINDVDTVMATMSRGPIRYSFDGHPFMNDGDTMAKVRTWENTKAMYDGVVALA